MSAKQAARATGAAVILVLGILAAPASATFPGQNGQISFFKFVETSNSAEIWGANADGTNQVQLTHSGANHAAVESDWSPDGQRIAFDSDRLRETDGDVQIFTMDRGGDQVDVKQVTTGSGFHGDPAYSPDGQWLAVEADLGDYPANEGIYIVPAAPSSPVIVQPTDKVVGIAGNWVGVSEPQFSPDGEWLTFTAFKNCNRLVFSHHPQPSGCTTAIYKVRTDGSDLQRMTGWGENASYSDWSPDGNWILHDTGDNGKQGQQGGIWEMRADGTFDHFLVAGKSSTQKRVNFYQNGVFSPDQQFLAFTHFLPITSQLEMSSASGANVTPTVVPAATDFVNRVDWGPAPAG